MGALLPCTQKVAVRICVGPMKRNGYNPGLIECFLLDFEENVFNILAKIIEKVIDIVD